MSLMIVSGPLLKARHDLAFVQEEVDGEEMVTIHDPWMLCGSPILVGPLPFRLLALLDGHHTFEQAVRLLRQEGFVEVTREDVEQLVEQFDALYLLEGERFQRVYSRQIAPFLASKQRPAAHAGVSYPSRRGELAPWVEGILAPAEGVAPLTHDEVSVVVAPHLDLRVEQEAYGLAYAGLKGRDPKRVVLLGTGHEVSRGLFSLSEKSFETPLGEMPCDLDAISLLRDAGGALCAPDDWAHLSEHALEFQLPFLQQVLARPDVPIVPILCGSVFSWITQGSERLRDIPGMGAFLEALRALIDDDTLVVVGVDFAHIGPKFGHESNATDLYESAHAHDLRLLEALCEGDAAGFWKANQEVHDQYNVCGFSSLSLILEALPTLKGTLLRHDYWFEEETQSAVSFASLHMKRER